MKDVSLKLANSADEEFLEELFCDVRSVEFIAAGMSVLQLKPLLAMQYNVQKHSYKGNFLNAENFIIELGDEKIGRLLIDRRERKVHLIDISILGDFRGRGIGGCLLEQLKTDAETISLSVFKTNFGALKLYEKHGFAVTDDDGMYFKMEWKNVG